MISGSLLHSDSLLSGVTYGDAVQHRRFFSPFPLLHNEKVLMSLRLKVVQHDLLLVGRWLSVR